MIKLLKLVAILATLLLVFMTFYGVFYNIFNTPGFWLLYLLVLTVDCLSIAVVKKYNG